MLQPKTEGRRNLGMKSRITQSDYASWTYKWQRGWAFPCVTIYNSANIAIAWIKGERARMLYQRLKSGVALNIAMRGIL